jgi:hypothetical protein
VAGLSETPHKTVAFPPLHSNFFITSLCEQTDEFKDYFLKTWPVALEKVKELSEKN